MRIGPAHRPTRRSLVVALSALLIGIALGALAPSASAQARLAGKYECVRIQMGQHSERCQSPQLVLHRDGTYEIWGEHGTYSVVQGRWLVLSHSKRRGLGQVQVKDPREIVFQYRMDGKVCNVTFRRLFEAPPGFKWG